MSLQDEEHCAVCLSNKRLHPDANWELIYLDKIKQFLTGPTSNVGADPNVGVTNPNGNGRCEGNSTEVIENAFERRLVLEDANSGGEVSDKEGCPLAFAVKLGKVDVVKILLKTLERPPDPVDRGNDAEILDAVEPEFKYFIRALFTIGLDRESICEIIRTLNRLDLLNSSFFYCRSPRKYDVDGSLFHNFIRHVPKTECIDEVYLKIFQLFMDRGASCVECLCRLRYRWELEPVLAVLKKGDPVPPYYKPFHFIYDHGLKSDKPLIEFIHPHPLHYASRFDIRTFEELLDHTSRDIEEIAFESGTVLFEAVLHNSVDNAEILLQRGAKVDAVSPRYNKTPLMIAAEKNCPECVEVLLDYGAHVYREVQGETPVSIAIEHNHFECLELLLSRVTGDLKIDRLELWHKTRSITRETVEVIIRYRALQEIKNRLPESSESDRLYQTLLENYSVGEEAHCPFDYLKQCKEELGFMQRHTARNSTTYYEILTCAIPDDVISALFRFNNPHLYVASVYSIYGKRINHILAKAMLNRRIKNRSTDWFNTSAPTLKQLQEYENNLRRQNRGYLRWLSKNDFLSDESEYPCQHGPT